MIKRYLLILQVLFLFSCKKNNGLPRVETISTGSKWGIQIGSGSEDVYARLQQLGGEKNFNEIEGINLQTFANPAEMGNRLALYRGFSLESNEDAIDRVIVLFYKGQVSSISEGRALPDEISQWPPDEPDESSLHTNDSVNQVYDRLVAIYQTTPYNDYRIRLANKLLEQSYDPGMAGSGEWDFNFTSNIRPGIVGRSFVRLYFKDGKLSIIRHEYDESAVYN